VLEAVPLVVEAGCAAFVAEVFLVLSTTVQSLVDAITPVVEPLIDAIAPVIQAILDAVAEIRRAAGRLCKLQRGLHSLRVTSGSAKKRSQHVGTNQRQRYGNHSLSGMPRRGASRCGVLQQSGLRQSAG
jgi:hypothetical protein